MTNTKGVIRSYFCNMTFQGNVLCNKLSWNIRHGFELPELNNSITFLNPFTPISATDTYILLCLTPDNFTRQ